MKWNEAKTVINRVIDINTDLNSKGSTVRTVTDVSKDGISVRIDQNPVIKVSWIMLEKCFGSLEHGYDGKSFRKHFAQEANQNDSYFHTVGQIFVKAEVAEQKKKAYWPVG